MLIFDAKLLGLFFLLLSFPLAGRDLLNVDDQTNPTPQPKHAATQLNDKGDGYSLDLFDNKEKVSLLKMPDPPSYLAIDDINEDGKLDLLVTSHGGNYTMLFHQTQDRDWGRGIMVKEVGFHPGELLIIPGDGTPPQYALLAEGENSIKFMSINPQGSLETAKEIHTSVPRAGSWFHWPEWGAGLVVAPFSRPYLLLIKGVDPKTGNAEGSIPLSIRPKYAYVEAITASDIGGNGIDKILFMNSTESKLMVIEYPCESNSPKMKELWTFSQGGNARFVIPSDIDQDGDIDLLIPDETEQISSGITGINVLLRNDSGTWSEKLIPIPGLTRADGGMTGLRGTDFAVDKDLYGYIVTAGYDRITIAQIPFGWYGEPVQLRQFHLSSKQGIPSVKLVDIDKDGWKDAIIAGGLPDGLGVMIIYGPLWYNLAEMPQNKPVDKDARQ